MSTATDVHEQKVKIHVQEHMARQLPLVAISMTWFYLTITVMHTLFLKGDMQKPMVAVALFSFGLYLGFWFLMKRFTIPERSVNLAACLLALIVFLNSLLHLYLSEEPKQTTNIMLAQIGIGVFFVERRWFWSTTVGGAIVWLFAVAGSAWSPDWLHFGFAYAFSIFLSALFFSLHTNMLYQVSHNHFLDVIRKEELEHLAATDGLTQLLNRRSFDLNLRREWQRCQQGGSPLSVILFDIDHFKGYNDTYGHQMGDDALFAVAQAAKSQLKRPSDLIARYGGEEFVALLPHTPGAGAVCVAEMMRKAIMELEVENSASQTNRSVTASFGVASWCPGEEFSASELLRRADQALYSSKHCGRNQVRQHDVADMQSPEANLPQPTVSPSPQPSFPALTCSL